MKKFLVIGNPIQHSLSPKLHNHWLKKNKIDAIYEKKLVDDDNIKEIITGIKENKIQGVNITVPFKKKIIEGYSTKRLLRSHSREATVTQFC